MFRLSNNSSICQQSKGKKPSSGKTAGSDLSPMNKMQQAQAVVRDVTPVMSKAMQITYLQTKQVLDRFHSIVFFADSMKQRRKMTLFSRSAWRNPTCASAAYRPTDEQRREVREHLRVDEALNAKVNL
ncbi:hypothetical protein [Saccharibacillus deserti]|uniref:hypothetical protein n=1 Tax=Saccharibacillus deserti TaxID=1634444 RepID=UPI0015578A5E|nr:hypothetical protein [Saccharibacillus deserti]